MSHYKSNLRDLEFNLFEVLDHDEVYGTGPFAEMDVETARGLLHEMAHLAEERLADSFADADRNPPRFDPETGAAPLPDSFKKSYQAYMDAEFWRLCMATELGGTPSPKTLYWALGELVLGANPAVWMYATTPVFATVLQAEGTAEQALVARQMVDRQWGSTMVLTEPDAGSDVGAGRTRAVRQEDGSWHIEGVKRFITSGESDLSDNIIHLVLARPEGHGPGTKGLSLFIVPKYDFDWETGELGERNGVYRDGTLRPARAWLVGERHDGIRQMFKIIELARMIVGSKAIATLSTGYLNALEYAKERVQGPDLTRFMDKTAPRVTITHHPDVRRSLLTQKAYAEGMRALVLYTASIQDQIALLKARGESADAPERLNDLLLPVVKGYGSEKSYEQLAQSLQTLGGSGYLQEYPIEQYIRDAKIDTLYEGTTAIQGQDFFFRKIVKDQGRALAALSEQIRKAVGTGLDDGLSTERELIARALGDLEAIVAAMTAALASAEHEVADMYLVGQNTTRLLLASGDVLVGWLLLRQATVAQAKLTAGAPAKDVPFYQGKIAAARHFTRTVLPPVHAQRLIAESVDNTIMDLPEAAF